MLCLAFLLPIAAAPPPATFDEWKKTVHNNLPATLVKTVPKAPVIDGKIDDLYKRCAPMVFRFMDNRKAKPTMPTTAWIVCDEKHLYVAVRCESEDPNSIPTSKKGHDAFGWQDEAVEFFIDPKNTRWKLYYHLIVNSLGTTHDSSEQFNIAWDPELKVKTTKEAKAWILELAIPFKELGIEPGRRQKIWSFNIVRTAYFKNGDLEEQAWSPIGDDSSHVPEMFGFLYFE
jgi:hypothetical protein